MTDRPQAALYVVLGGIAGGVVLAALVLLVCKVCFRKSPQTVFSGGNHATPSHHPHYRKYNSVETRTAPLDMERSPSPWDSETAAVPVGKASTSDQAQIRISQLAAVTWPENNNVRELNINNNGRGGIQRQTSICLSDGEEDMSRVLCSERNGWQVLCSSGSSPEEPSPASPTLPLDHYSKARAKELVDRGAALVRDAAISRESPAEWPPLHRSSSTELGALEHRLDRTLRTLSRDGSPVAAVRYHDPGSREDIHEEQRNQYRKLWELRATLEEEENELSEPPKTHESPEDKSSEDNKSPEAVTYVLPTPALPSEEMLHKAKERRKDYRTFLKERLAGGSTETEESSTDKSRVTTSLESDSAVADVQNHRLQQMKSDSGYKSLETTKPPRLGRFSGDSEDTSPDTKKLSLKKKSLKKRPVSDSLETAEKTSRLQRLFRTERPRLDRLLQRDYSIDEKSDALFREFSWPDPAYDRPRKCLTESPRKSPQISIEEETELAAGVAK